MRKYIISIAVLFIMFLLLNNHAKAEEQPAFTLDEAIEKALINNPELQVGKASLDISNVEALKATEFLKPSFIAEGFSIINVQRVGLRVPLELGGRRKSKINIARTKTEITAIQIKTSILELRNNVRQAYTRVFSGQEKIKYCQEISNTAKTLLEIAQKRNQPDDLDVILAESLLLNINNDMETAKYDFVEEKNSLARLVGEPIPENVSFQAPNKLPQSVRLAVGQDLSSLEQIQPEALIEIAIKKRPELQENYKRLELLEFEKSMIKATRIPVITLSSGVDMTNNGDNTRLMKMFFAADVPFPDGRQIKVNIKDADARINQVNLEQKVIRDNIAFEVNNAYINFISTRKRVERYENELLPKLQEVVRKSIEHFAAGKSSVLVTIDIEQSFISNSFGYLQSLSDYQNTIGALERALGIGL